MLKVRGESEWQSEREGENGVYRVNHGEHVCACVCLDGETKSKK